VHLEGALRELSKSERWRIATVTAVSSVASASSVASVACIAATSSPRGLIAAATLRMVATTRTAINPITSGRCARASE
jgi:hypothetical protein